MKKTSLVAALACAAGTAFGGTIYSTGFDTSEGFVNGGIHGQNGWSTYDPSNVSGGGTFASITASAPSGFGGDRAFSFTSGTGATSSPRYAWSPNYGSTFASDAASGMNIIVSQVDMYMASGSTSAARQGMVTFDASGAKILTGFYVQANTGMVYLLANYNNGGTINNFAFNTNVTIGYNQWVRFTTKWNQATGRMEVFWGANGFFVDGAAAGSVADETDFYNTRNNSTVSTTVFFDNLVIATVPTPGSAALLGLGGLVAARRRR